MHAVFTFIKGLNFRAPVVAPQWYGVGILVFLNGLRVWVGTPVFAQAARNVL